MAAALIDADYNQVFLLPPALEDWVPPQHPARFIREFVEALDLSQLGLSDTPCGDGRPAYAKALLLKIWLMGYFLGIRSHRKLEQACYENLALIWLAGMHQPDHNTLWRFWQSNKAAIGRLYRQSVQVAINAGLVELALVALDGTKIQAASSTRSGRSKDQLKALLARLDQSLQEHEQEIEANHQQESKGYPLPETLQERQELKQAVQSALAQLEQSERKYFQLQEPQTRRMQCGGLNRFAYNAQAVADAKEGIIIAAEVGNQENDVGQLPLMLEQVREVVEQSHSPQEAEGPGSKASEAGALNAASAEPAPSSAGPTQAKVPTAQLPVALADSGYAAGADIAAAQAQGFEVFTPVPQPRKDEPYHASKFTFNPAADVSVCPKGQALTFERERIRDGTKIRIYRCPNTECPVRAACTKDAKGRSVEVTEHHSELVAMRQKMASPQAQAIYAERAPLIELRFARIKTGQAFRRWTVRGLEKVQAQWKWICLTANLKIFFAHWRNGTLKFG